MAIQDAFRKKCRSATGVWAYFELLECEAVSDEAMTVGQADRLARWSADHISLRSNPPAPMRTDD